MIVTEEEAKELLCKKYPVCNVNCAASKCMHWRWDEPYEDIIDLDNRYKHPGGDGWHYSGPTLMGHYHWTRKNENRKGHCGLSGPQGFV